MLGRPRHLIIALLLMTAFAVPTMAAAKGPEDPRPPECGYSHREVADVEITQYRSWWPNCRGEVVVHEDTCGADSSHGTYIAGGWTVTVYDCLAGLELASAAPCKDTGVAGGVVSVYLEDCGVHVVILEGLHCLWDTRSKTFGKHPAQVTYYYCGNGQDPR